MDRLFKSEAFRFVVVGGVATIVDLCVFNVALFILPYVLCAILGFVVSFGFNYYLSAKWTFRKRTTTNNFIGMIGVHLVNLFMIRTGLLYLFVDILLMQPKTSYLFVLSISAVLSFLLNRIVFHRL